MKEITIQIMVNTIQHFVSLYRKHEFNLNCISMDEHIIWTLKKCRRCSQHNTPFPKLPKHMVIWLLQNVMFYHNVFPLVDGVSDLSPLTIVQGKIIDFTPYCRVELGAYAQTKNLTENNIHACTTGGIRMSPSLNYQGGVHFYSLSTSMALDRSKNEFIIVPMPEEAI